MMNQFYTETSHFNLRSNLTWNETTGSKLGSYAGDSALMDTDMT